MRKLVPYKYVAYNRLFNRLKDEIAVPSVYKKLVSIGIYAETDNVSDIKLLGHLSIETNQNDDIYEIPMQMNAPLAIADFMPMNMDNTKGDLKLKIVYKPIEVQEDYIIKIVGLYEL